MSPLLSALLLVALALAGMALLARIQNGTEVAVFIERDAPRMRLPA